MVKNTKEQLSELYDKRSVIYKRNSTFMVNGNAKDKTITMEIAKLVRFSEQKNTEP